MKKTKILKSIIMSMLMLSFLTISVSAESYEFHGNGIEEKLHKTTVSIEKVEEDVTTMSIIIPYITERSHELLDGWYYFEDEVEVGVGNHTKNPMEINQTFTVINKSGYSGSLSTGDALKDYGKAELGIDFSEEVRKELKIKVTLDPGDTLEIYPMYKKYKVTERKIPFQNPSEEVIVNVGYIYELKGMDYRVK
ncbi:hypothetical protein [Wukongibacter sp. M2B1]|uniref:hypothetical protein n=1 Tax=Wukongibacter sp. M2B1 TaxID=3088895 RepID=UPI003D79BC79